MSAINLDQAREALRLADADPGRATAYASDVLDRALRAGDLAAASVAEKAIGLAALHLHDLDAARAHLRKAIGYGRRIAPRLAAEARMTLAFVLNRRGRSQQALREIDTAILDLDGVEQARALAQRGAMLHELGRFGEALDSYQKAYPLLRRAGDHSWVLRVLSNRGLVHGIRLEFAAAVADLHEAERLSDELDLGLRGAIVQQNLGYVHALRGDVPAALHYVDIAEGQYRELGSRNGALLVDRSELLLSVRLVSEAREAAEQAVAAFEREHRRVALPEARLLLAHAAQLDGDAAGALRQARRAVRELNPREQPEWLALARYAVLTARHALGSPVSVKQVEDNADALGTAGWSAYELEARLLAARLAAARGAKQRERGQLGRASRARRRRGPATLRARAWYAEARLRVADGNSRGALVAVRTGLRVLDEYRAALGATDLRAYASGHRTELAELGLRIALADGRPDRILNWAEQGRASHLLMRPVRPPEDPALLAALAELRATMAQLDETRGEQVRGAPRLVTRQIALERRIRDYCRQQRGAGQPDATEPVPLAALTGQLAGTALLEYIQLDGELYVVTVVAGRARVHRLGPLSTVRDLVESVPFALRRLARNHASAASQNAAVTLLRHAATRLDDIVLRPVAAEIGDRPLVLIPTGLLQSLPWSILPSCAGRPVTVSPSASLWYAAARRPPEPGGRVVVAGYGPPGAVAEADLVAAIHGTKPLVGAAATVDNVAASMDGAGLAHVAAHGRVHTGNPLFSSLLLADGPLTVYDLERLERVPRLVILAACDSGRTIVCAGDEVLGMSATFLSHGAQQVIASVVPVPDAETAPLMVAFHRFLVAGRPAAEALALAQGELAGAGMAATAAAAGFVCIGAEYRLA